MSVMANYWSQARWDIHLITMDGMNDRPFYPLNSAVVHHQVDFSQPLGNPFFALFRVLERIWRLRRTLREVSPDLVLSFMDVTNVMVLLAVRGLGIPVVVAERTDPHRRSMKQPWHVLRHWSYRQASCVVAQTQHAMEYFSPSIRLRGRIIANPVVVPIESCRPERSKNADRSSKVILAMGRLEMVKGFDSLIRAFASLAGRHPQWTLVIWGEGVERASLEKMVAEMGLVGRVNLPGLTNDPTEKMRNADLFVLSSRYEGFPNVLCEAMACGMPVVSFDCESGPSDIIHDGVDGLLVPAENIAALSGAIERLITNEAERCRLAACAPRIIERFGLGKIMGQWSDLVRELISESVAMDEER